jgi:GDP-L-fucose synthase
LWGTGEVYREFLFVDDLAGACVYLMDNYDSSEIINIGTGKDLTIKELAEKIKSITGFDGGIKWDKSKPDGTKRKKLDVGKLNKTGWNPKISLEAGIGVTYKWFLENNK